MGNGENDRNAGSPPADGLQMAEIELRRYEARLGVWKVVLGTFIVGLAGIIIPAAINLTTLFFDDWRARAELAQAKQTAHQQYIKDFFDTAVNQDVELRIRFANYFANLSEAEQKKSWAAYLEVLTEQRNENRDKINHLEAQLVALQQLEQNQNNVTELDRIARELNWTYSEIGYVPLDRSVVQVVPGKTERLYTETVDVVARLARLEGAIDSATPDYRRFWELYRRDLIGVESRAVANKMIAIGRVLEGLVARGEAPNDALKQLSFELGDLIDFELRASANASGGSLQQMQSAMPAAQRN